MSNKIFRQFRQGDVIVHTSVIPKDAVLVPPTQRGIVLAEGEVTGHYHKISVIDKQVSCYEKNGKLYLHVEDDVELTHDEHSTIQIPPGDYVSYIQREFSPLLNRKVLD